MPDERMRDGHPYWCLIHCAGFVLFIFIDRMPGPLSTPAGTQQGGSCSSPVAPAQVHCGLAL